MKTYPTTITPDIMKQLAHISDTELTTDITDTEHEMELLQVEAQAYKDLAHAKRGTVHEKIELFRYDAALAGLEERNNFVRFLRAIQTRRKECTGIVFELRIRDGYVDVVKVEYNCRHLPDHEYHVQVYNTAEEAAPDLALWNAQQRKEDAEHERKSQEYWASERARKEQHESAVHC